jgi:hypothetical protein
MVSRSPPWPTETGVSQFAGAFCPFRLWKGQRGNVTMVGELYHNERDGWMYSEQLFQNGRQTYSMLSDCHLMQGE